MVRTFASSFENTDSEAKTASYSCKRALFSKNMPIHKLDDLIPCVGSSLFIRRQIICTLVLKNIFG